MKCCERGGDKVRLGSWGRKSRGLATHEVVPADDDGAGHLAGRDDLAGEDATTDGDIAGEGALLVC